jgi:hypothetical protein
MFIAGRVGAALGALGLVCGFAVGGVDPPRVPDTNASIALEVGTSPALHGVNSTNVL